MLKKIRRFLKQNQFFINLYRRPKIGMGLIYKFQDLNHDYYSKVKKVGDRELEHQIGRLTNFRQIISEISENNIEGNFLEFGSWQGFSLLWIAYLIERAGIFKRKIISVDGFVGLPNSEGIFQKYTFLDTSKEICRKNILLSKDLYQITKDNVFIEKYLYSQKDTIIKRINNITKGKFCFIHIDCDISTSVKEVFKILKEGDFLGDNCYLLFDDYGCVKSYRNTVDNIIDELSQSWGISEHSSTLLTKNFKLVKK